MYTILQKTLLAPDIYFFRVSAPRIAASAKAGQFVIVRLNEQGERIPLTIAGFDSADGTIDMVVQIVGASTHKMCQLGEGDTILDIAGALGNPSDFTKELLEKVRSRRYLLVAGGVGAAPIYPQAKWLHENGARVDVIIGARTADLIIFADKMRDVCDTLYICTDDGSAGFAGNVTECMADLIERQNKTYDIVITIGPMIMMKFVALYTKKLGIETIASLNTLMVDGTGMCGACRVSVDGVMKFACVDGPEFDAHKVDFDEAIRRNKIYSSQEKEAYSEVSG